MVIVWVVFSANFIAIVLINVPLGMPQPPYNLRTIVKLWYVLCLEQFTSFSYYYPQISNHMYIK